MQVGFTLIEFLMYMGIFAILLLALFQLLTSILDSQEESQATSSVEEDGKFILTRLTYDIQSAQASASAQAIVIPSTVGTPSATLKLTIGNTAYIYATNSGNLVVTNNLVTNAPINGYDTTVSNVSFTRLGNPGGKNAITASFTLTSKTTRTEGPEVRTYTTTIGTR